MSNQEVGGSGLRSAPKRTRTYILRQREEAEQRLIDDYFCEDDTPPKYLEENFGRRAPKAPFVVNRRTYNKCYYLADGNYTAWATFVKTYSIAMDEKTLKFKRVQESSRKDTERAFGVLQGSSNGNGDIMDDNTRRYVDDALDGIIMSMEEMLNQITALSLQTQSINGAIRPQTQYGRMTKIDFPKFLGKDVWGWIFRQLLKVHEETVTWPVYRDAIMQRFGTVFDDPMSKLKNVNLYLGGLPTKIEMGVRMFKPQSLTDAYCLTNLQEATLNAVKKKSNMQFSAKNEEMEEEFVDADDSLKDVENDEVQPQISLNALNGMSSFQTLRVVGLYDDKHELHILVDPWSTHNFLEINMAKRLGCNIKKTCPLSIVVAGDKQLTMRNHRLFAKKSKCVFGTSHVEYLSHVISTQGLATDHSKIVAMQDWHVPTNIKQLRGFIGLTGYYRKFIKDFASLSRPRTQLLKNNSYKWSDEAQSSLLALKTLMRVVLQQKGHLIAYLSKSLAPKHHTLSTYEKEFLAVMMALEKRRGYLLDRHFIIKIDRYSLKYLLDQRITISTKMKWLTKLIGFDYEVKYKKGVDNAVDDALSRVQTESQLMTVMLVTMPTKLTARIEASWKTDGDLQQTLLELQDGKDSRKHYTWSNGQLLRKNKMVVRKDEQLRMDLLTYFHSSFVGGHSGMKVTTHKLCSVLYWKDSQVSSFPSCNQDGLLAVEPIVILERKMVKKRNVVQVFGLIQWANETIEDATWEPLAELCEKFPTFLPHS
nr:gypsy/Ty3 retroelement polyprotein [Tanacetum cinerariifolium]